jgi:hypothetical protein
MARSTLPYIAGLVWLATLPACTVRDASSPKEEGDTNSDAAAPVPTNLDPTGDAGSVPAQPGAQSDAQSDARSDAQSNVGVDGAPLSCAAGGTGVTAGVLSTSPPPTNPSCPQTTVANEKEPPATTSYIYPRHGVVPFYQWENNNGYCGEVSILEAGMNNGQWVSQLNTRLVCGGQGNGMDAPVGASLSQSGPDGYCASHDGNADYNAQVLLENQAVENPATCLSNARLAYKTYDYSANNVGLAGYQNYMAWVKSETMLGNQVTVGILDGGGDQQYDHEVTVAAIGTNHSPSDASYYDDDVLYIEDHGALSDFATVPAIPPGAGGTPGCTPYVFGYTFGELPMTFDEFNGSSADYAIIIPGQANVVSYTGGDGVDPGPPVTGHNYAFSVTGPADDDGFLLPVTVTITSSITATTPNPADFLAGYDSENPFIGTATNATGCSNVAPMSMAITLSATVGGLTAGGEYNLYEYDIATVSGIGANAGLPVPTSAFNAQASMASKVTHFTATGATFVATVMTTSTETVVFRAVPACAP